jgi:BirA family biotin operon repressor/biotin-[acetyl-CoA-carboxylase] ligase
MEYKDQIFMLLEGSDEILSGEKISQELGISRVSVWKHIQGMIANGIPIASSSKGYRLGQEHDSLNPLVLGRFKDLIHYLPETGSTMNQAATLARQGCPHLSVVTADRQTEGRGRMQRSWFSTDGGLYFTVVLRPEITLVQASLVNLAAAVDMAEGLQSLYGVEARLKWPNDILVDGRKICGLLSQMEAEGGQVAYLNVGIGLNVNNDPLEQESSATSLKILLGRTVLRRQILMEFLERFEQRLADFDPELMLDQWKANNTTLGKLVSIATIKETLSGTAIDLDAHGGLVLETDDGTHRTAIHGDCFYNQPPPISE